MDKVWSIVLEAGGKWSGKVKKGKTIKFTALKKGANISLLVFSADDLTEKYSMPDTLKAQYTSRLRKGNVLMSDNGRVLASIVEDSLDWHDTLSGFTTRELTDSKYGTTTYQDLRNKWLKCGLENFAVELVRNGLSIRDLVPNVNLFSKVFCNEAGEMFYDAEHCQEGATVTLRTDMDVLLILSNTPNPLDTSKTYSSVPVEVKISDAEPLDLEQDYCANFRGENRRAFENTAEYYSNYTKEI